MPEAPKIDLLDPAAYAGDQPHAQFRWLREHAPVYWHPEPDGRGFFALTRHEEVRAVGRDPARFSSEPTIMIPDPAPGTTLQAGDHQMMLTMDPPRHTQYRRLLSREFTPRAAERLRPRIAELARQIVDAVRPRGECDLVEDVAGELPSYVIAELMGIPLDDGRELYRLTETIHSAPGSVPPGAHAQAVLQMFNYAAGVAREKRARPGADLASQILAAEVDGRRLDDIDFNLFFLLLIDAGGDTTRNLLGAGMHALFEHPDQRARLEGDLDRGLPTAVEELLRWVSPVVYMRRTATRDVELNGTKIREGDKVVMYYGAANRDPRAFADPERLELDRDPNPHVAFGGGGAHFCLGAHIARVEIQVMLAEILRRLPGLEPAGPAEWLASNFIYGPRRLPVRFRAAGARCV